MSIDLECGNLMLNRRGVALLRGARGLRVLGRRGAAWLTIDGERRDVVLNPGEAFVVDTDRDVVISALVGPVEVAVRAAPRRVRAPLWARVVDLIAGTARVAA